MAMITDASLASETEAEGVAFARGAADRGRGDSSACASGWGIRLRGRPT